MPIIRVEMYTGRSRNQNRELIKERTETFMRVAGSGPQSVTVVLTDIAKENWGSGGERCADKFPD